MRKARVLAVPSPHRPWVVDARRSTNIVLHDRRHYRWRSPAPGFDRFLRGAFASALIALAPAPALAAFNNPTTSALSSAMGDASLARPGDPAALFLNPAGSAGLAGPEAYMQYDRLHAGLGGSAGLGRGFAAFGVPTRIGAVGVGLSHFSAAGLMEERVLGVSLARNWSNSLALGLTVKHLHHKYMTGGDALAAADPVFGGGNASGAFTMDAGFVYALTDFLKTGFAVRNVNRPDVGLASEDRVPREYQAGLAYEVRPWALRLTGDYAYRDADSGTLRDRSRPSVGLEKGFENEQVKFRVGASLDQFTAGIGVDFGPFGFDYAFRLSRRLATSEAGSHVIGLRYRFGAAQ